MNVIGKRNNASHHDLEAIEAPSLGSLNLIAEPLNKILVDNPIGGSEEGKDV